MSHFSNFSYNGPGNRIAVTASIPAASALSGDLSYSYDNKNQLTSESSSRGSGFATSYSYDSAGNPVLYEGNSRSYNVDNQLVASGMTYDGNGNPTTYAGTSLTFDTENKLTVVYSLMSAGYRIDGLRAWKQNATTGVVTYFLYDGQTPVMEASALGVPVATNTFGARGLVSRTLAGAGTTFYTFDERGSVAQRTTASGAIISSDLYSAFGNIIVGGNDPFCYGAQAGYYTDHETGLVLCTFRYYDPNAGRSINRDPLGYAGGINLYAYCGNNPLMVQDPTGQNALVIAIGIGVGIEALPWIILGILVIAIIGILLYLWWLAHPHCFEGPKPTPPPPPPVKCYLVSSRSQEKYGHDLWLCTYICTNGQVLKLMAVGSCPEETTTAG